MKLGGQVAFITGAGRGIGESIAKAFSRAGARVVLLARTASEVGRVASEVETDGGIALALSGDVSVLSDVENSVAAALERFGQIDFLVNCAGILGPIGRLVDNNPEAWVKTIQVNLMGTMLCLRAVLPHMIARRRGVVVNLSGGGSVTPMPRFSAYSASKAAVVRLTETIAEEVKEYGIRVNAISPGAVNTRMLDQTIAAGEAAGGDYHSKVVQIKAEGGTPPTLAADLAVFLASQEAAGITGRLISAVWDDWQSLPGRTGEISNSSMFTLRRIDGRHFTEKV
jgi:NAD(P)-dependent dehydrogenase (short-subunit alcohol dehydrogenase family)